MVLFLSFVTFALASTVVASVGSGVRRRELRMENNLKRSADIADCSDVNQWWWLYDSYMDESYTLAAVALDYITSRGINDLLFIAYFGAGLKNSTLQTDTFSVLADDNNLNLSCADPSSSCATNADIANLGTYSVDNHLYFCPSFFNQFTTSELCTDATPDIGLIRGGTMLLQVSRVVYGTQWSSGSCSAARDLASSNPYLAARTGDNYSCFAMQVYTDTECSIAS